MRSDFRFSEASTTLEERVQTETVKLAFSGATGVQFTLDYRDVEVLSAYTRFDLGSFSWAVMAEIDRAELFSGRGRDLMALLVGELVVFFLTIWTFTFFSVDDLAFGTDRRVGSFLTDVLDDIGT